MNPSYALLVFIFSGGGTYLWCAELLPWRAVLIQLYQPSTQQRCDQGSASQLDEAECALFLPSLRACSSEIFLVEAGNFIYRTAFPWLCPLEGNHFCQLPVEGLN